MYNPKLEFLETKNEMSSLFRYLTTIYTQSKYPHKPNYKPKNMDQYLNVNHKTL